MNIMSFGIFSDIHVLFIIINNRAPCTCARVTVVCGSVIHVRVCMPVTVTVCVMVCHASIMY